MRDIGKLVIFGGGGALLGGWFGGLVLGPLGMVLGGLVGFCCVFLLP